MTTQSTIKTLIEIPAKYKWYAIDEDGEHKLHERTPRLSHDSFRPYGGYWLSDGEQISLFFSGNNPDWKNTLQRIEEYEEVE